MLHTVSIANSSRIGRALSQSLNIVCEMLNTQHREGHHMSKTLAYPRPSFEHVAKEVGNALVTSEGALKSRNELVAQMYAIGYLSRMSKKEINIRGRETSGVTPETWAGTKVALSRAHRAIAGEYGFREKLAERWAIRDFTLSLVKAYNLSAPPRKQVDVVIRIARLLAKLSSEQVQSALHEYVEIAHFMALRHNEISSTVAESWLELEKTA